MPVAAEVQSCTYTMLSDHEQWPSKKKEEVLDQDQDVAAEVGRVLPGEVVHHGPRGVDVAHHGYLAVFIAMCVKYDFIEGQRCPGAPTV